MSYNAIIYKSNKYKYKLTKVENSSFIYKVTEGIPSSDHSEDVENNLINIHEDVEYQTFGGIGGAFTDAAASAWSKLSNEKKREFIEAYFSKEKGIGYTLGRITIASCDFSKDDYTYLDENDTTLESFDISHDKTNIIPMIYEAQK